MRKMIGLLMIWLSLPAMVAAPLPAAGDGPPVIALLPAVHAPLSPQASTYWVNSNGNESDSSPGDGQCLTSNGYCTLRAAIREANLDGTESIIRFTQRFVGSNHIYDCDLYISEDGTTIDASDQWDTVTDTPGIVVVGSCPSWLTIAANQTTVWGLEFAGSTVIIRGGWNTIGGEGPGQRNVFIGEGVYLASGEGHHQILNNYFGTLHGTYAQGSGTLVVEADDNTIAGNVVLGSHKGTGIEIHMGDRNQIHDNHIGVGVDQGFPAPLKTGIRVHSASDNVIGPNNVIAGSDVYGIEITGSKGSTILGNIIGNDSPLGGSNGNQTGIYIGDLAEGTLVQDNQIHKNFLHGVFVNDAEVTLEGNFITGSFDEAVLLTGGWGQIGGSTAGKRNIISGNGSDGIHLYGSNAVTISGNCIGLADNCIDDMGNEGHGILLENGAASNTIGGDEPGEGNWIAWNHKDGIHLSGEGTQLNFIQGNILGAPMDWSSPAANRGKGIAIGDGAVANFLGGLNEGQGNTILASGLGGVAIVDSEYNAVLANHIGTDGAGHNWGNALWGIYVGGANNSIGHNEIAFNGISGDLPGVWVQGAGATSNVLAANSIHSNAGAGISLTDGGNGELPAPELKAASCSGPVTGIACAGCTVEIFSDSDDEGRVYEGETEANASTGAFSWSGAVNGPNVTATATDAGYNTSEFSAPKAVGQCNSPPTAAFTIHPGTGTVKTVFTFDASASTDKEDPASTLEVCWDWQNDGVCDTKWQTGKTQTHSFGRAGEHVIRLRVRDSGGLQGTTTKKLSVSEDRVPNRTYLPIVVKD